MIRAWVLGCALVLAACGQQNTPTADESAGAAAPYEEAVDAGGPSVDDLEPVNPVLLSVSNDSFAAIEASELGVFGAPTVLEALGAIIPPEAFEEDASVSVSLREEGDQTIADIVRENIPDDSVAAGHIRIEFRREADGWYPTNTYRRWMCRRGASANQWTSELCP